MMQQSSELLLLPFPAPLGARRSIPGTPAPRSVSDGCWIARRSPWAAASAEGCPSLFGCFTGNTQRSDSCSTYASAVWLCAFADRPVWFTGAPQVSRFSCMLFLDVRGVFDHAASRSGSRCVACGGCCLPSMQTGSARGSSVFGAPSPGPPMPLSTLRRTPRDVPRKTQGQNRVAAPFL
jgi:hypothetical protein